MSPDRKCVCFVLLSLCSLVTSHPNSHTVSYPQVELTKEWSPTVGWKVTCSWDMGPEPLMSVNFRKDNELVARYRPSDDVPSQQVYRSPYDKLQFHCIENHENLAMCTLTIKSKQPPEKSFEISCEVNGDAPMFSERQKSLTIEPVVPHSDAIIEVLKTTEYSGPMLNYSSTGIPAVEMEGTVQSKTAQYNNTTSQIELRSKRSLIVAQPIRNTTVVELTQEWRPEVGWVVTCSWDLAPHDRLQSVNLHRDNQHFSDYKPGFNGPNLRHSYSTPDDDMQLMCEESSANCTIIIEPMQPPKKDISILCEVSGEGPMFRVGRQNLTIDTSVPPSDAILEVSKATEELNPVLNCSSTGVPAPRIEWTTSDSDTKIPPIYFHSSRVWNATSKLWYSWSTFIPASHQLPVTCTVKVTKGSNLYGIKTAEYNGASRIEFESVLGTILTTLSLVLMS